MTSTTKSCRCDFVALMNGTACQSCQQAARYPLYPEVEVQLSGQDGNAFAVLGAVRKALTAEVGAEAAEAFMEEATSGDYDHLLQTCMKYVEVS